VNPLSALLRFLGFGAESDPREKGAPKPAARGGVIGEGLRLKGEVSGEGDLEVLGKFEGEIALTGAVQVWEGAEVDGNISATAIVIGGVVHGNLSASTRVEILPTGALTGTLKSGSFMAAEGATVKGEVWVEPTPRTGPPAGSV
jgi:cytoskeletal protein CcmA (bactofilin family)